jgi:EmrB/QacA subfamily drug resistance transporter
LQLGWVRDPAGHGGRGVALTALCTLVFLTFLDNTVVSVGLGSIQTDLKASVSALQWVVGGYALSFASIMLACGMIGDELGRKTVMLTGAAVFCAGSVLCALAPNSGALIAGRVIMGLGAAASEPGTLSMLRHIYTDDRQRARAVGVWSATTGLALALGPVIGGTIVGVWSWRGIFWFNLFFGLAALLTAARVLPESADPTAARVDTAGTFLGAGALALLTFAIIDAETAGFGSPLVITLLCVAAVLGVVFAWWELRVPHPLLDLRYLRIPQFGIANVVAYCTYFATFAIFFFTALYLNEVANASGFRIAAVFAPMTVLMIVASLLTGLWTGAAGPRWPVTAGCVLFAGGLLLATLFLRTSPDYLPLALSLALAGTGIGITIVPVTSSVLAAVPPQRSGMAASATNTSREIGAVTGVAVLGALVYGQLTASLTRSFIQLGIPTSFRNVVLTALETGQIPQNTSQYSAYGPMVQEVIKAAYSAFGDGLHAALYLSAGLVAAAGLLAAVTLRQPGAALSPDDAGLCVIATFLLTFRTIWAIQELDGNGAWPLAGYRAWPLTARSGPSRAPRTPRAPARRVHPAPQAQEERLPCAVTPPAREQSFSSSPSVPSCCAVPPGTPSRPSA